MAFVASDRYVPGFERILGGRVILHSKNRGLEAVQIVARRAITSVRAGPELTLVRILVAVHAFRERHRRFEVPVGVTIAARDGGVFAKQGIFCLGVVEPLQLGDAVPVRRVMAGLARRRKTAFVRIRVATRTLRE